MWLLLAIPTLILAVWLINREWVIRKEDEDEEARQRRDWDIHLDLERQRLQHYERGMESLYWETIGELDRIEKGETD
jgi:hypothetical protein